MYLNCYLYNYDIKRKEKQDGLDGWIASRDGLEKVCQTLTRQLTGRCCYRRRMNESNLLHNAENMVYITLIIVHRN